LALSPTTPPPPTDKLAQRKAAQDDVFLREVDDALRQDEALGVLKRYGVPIAIVLIAALLALGGYLWWREAQSSEAAARGEEMTKALDQVEAGRLDQGSRLLDPVIKDADDGSLAAARLMRGGIALEQGRADQAAREFAAVAADAAAPKPFSDLATIREVATRFDTLPADQVVSRLKPLAVPGNPWFGSAGELLGIAYMKQGRNDLAGPLFASIARDQTVPETLRRRVRQLAGLLGVDAIDDAAKAAAGDSPPGQAAL
jgi:hypothetical protein